MTASRKLRPVSNGQVLLTFTLPDLGFFFRDCWKLMVDWGLLTLRRNETAVLLTSLNWGKQSVQVHNKLHAGSLLIIDRLQKQWKLSFTVS